MLKKLFVAALVAAGLAGALPAAEVAQTESTYAYAGKYTFRVDVRNRYGQFVNMARARAWLIGDRQAEITVEADGYQDARGYVNVNPNQTYYNVSATLQDPTVYVDVLNEKNQMLPHYTQPDSFGAWGDEYKFVSRVKKDGYSKFTAQHVQLQLSGGFPFGEQIRVRDFGSQREIEVVIKRRDLTKWSNFIRVKIPSDEALAPPPTQDPPPPVATQREKFRVATFRELHGD